MEIGENRNTWDVTHDWAERGEEWSVAWGGSEAQWFSCIYPRIHRLLPAATVLEIAPGFGRWTNYLLRYCRHLIGVDLSTVCVQACRQRFARQHAEFHANDGTSLEMVPNSGIDFAFSFDSLVHAEAPVLESYIHQLATKLAEHGVGLIHHSNLGAYSPHVDNPGKRAHSMTAALFLEFTKRVGLACFSQELVNWSQPELVDCFSMITHKGSRFDRPYQRHENPNFMAEADLIKGYSRLYNRPIPHGSSETQVVKVSGAA